ncbi:MAG: SH3 domain-containing protein [Chloroflexota bacterium]|nr:SH3 domain-containing protein [Chloroflexota bacterium]
MNEEKKNKKTWRVIGWIALAAVSVAAIVLIVNAIFGGSGDTGDAPIVPMPPIEPGVPIATALEAVHVRSGPGTQFPSYGVAAKGASAEVIGVSDDGGWWVVNLPVDIAPDGQGWASAEYVQVEGGEDMPVIPPPPMPPIEDIPTPPAGTPTATALDYINVRSGPGVQYPVHFVAAKGATGEVLGVSEDQAWWVIKLSTDLVSEEQGWVSAEWVSTTDTDDVPVIPAP